MAASSGLALSFARKSVVHGAGMTLSSSSLVQLHGVAVGTISRRNSLIQRHGASLVSPRCKAGFDDALLNSLYSLDAPADRYTRERCSIILIGICGPSIPVETREKLAIVESKWSRSIEELCKLDHIENAAVLSTCSRMEIYVVALCQDRGVLQVTDWISKSSGVPVSEICKHRVVLCNKDAVEHLFEVASGLELGENHILEQLLRVCHVGRAVAGFGSMLNHLFMSAFGAGARVRRETSIAAGAVYVSSAAVELALMKLSESSSSLVMARIMVVGAGLMGKLVIRDLVARGCKKIVVVTCCRASLFTIRRKVKEEEGVEIIYKPVSEMYECAATADVVFTCTNSEKSLFLKQDVEKLAPAQVVGGLRLFFDFSVPRNVGPCVNSLRTARVYNIDDLKQVAAEASANKKDDHRREVMKARPIIDEETRLFEDWRDSFWTVDVVERERGELEKSRITWVEERLSEFGDDITEAQRKSIEDSSWDWINEELKKMLAFMQRPYVKSPRNILWENHEWI